MVEDVFNQNGERVSSIELPDNVFGVKFNADLVHQALRAKLSSRRQHAAHVKGRGEVRGGGKKPWRQKGTGRARHGSIRSPIWVGGGVTHGPTKERNFKLAINKKMNRKAIAIVFSQKAKDKELRILDSISLTVPKTKEAARIVENFFPKRGRLKNPSLLILNASGERALVNAFRNLPKAKIINADNVNLLDLLNYQYVFMTKEVPEILASKYKSTQKF